MSGTGNTKRRGRMWQRLRSAALVTCWLFVLTSVVLWGVTKYRTVGLVRDSPVRVEQRNDRTGEFTYLSLQYEIAARWGRLDISRITLPRGNEPGFRVFVDDTPAVTNQPDWPYLLNPWDVTRDAVRASSWRPPEAQIGIPFIWLANLFGAWPAWRLWRRFTTPSGRRWRRRRARSLSSESTSPHSGESTGPKFRS